MRLRTLGEGIDRVAIFAPLEIVVYNFASDSIEFKLKLIKYGVPPEISCSEGWMAISQGNQSLLLNFATKYPQQNFSSRLACCDSPVVTLNDLLERFKAIYPFIFKLSGKDNKTAGKKVKNESGYLCIDENMVDYRSPTYFPVSIKYPDYIDKYNISHEHTLLQLKYCEDFCIWDFLIREGLAHNNVEISLLQMDRIIYPVISYDNQSLLHEYSRSRLEALQ